MLNKNGLLNPWLIIPLVLFLFIGLAARDRFEVIEQHNKYLLSELNEVNSEIKTIKIRILTIEESDEYLKDKINALNSYINATREELKIDIGNSSFEKYDSMISEIWKFLDVLDKRTKFD